MDFGEIVAPSTRALLYDEDDFVPEENLDWEIKANIPSKITSLLISETCFTNKIIKSVLLQDKNPVAETKNKVISIYNFDNARSKYIVLCNKTSNSSLGHITEELLPWIQAAEKNYTLVTQSIATYLNKNMIDKPDCVLRMLSTATTNQNANTLCPRLETPNLITGIGANCLSYCTFNNQECLMFVGYIDHAPIDSVNSQPFLNLLDKVGFDSKGKVYKLVDKLPENNLYI